MTMLSEMLKLSLEMLRTVLLTFCRSNSTLTTSPRKLMLAMVNAARSLQSEMEQATHSRC